MPETHNIQLDPHMVTVDRREWKMLADVVQDLGRVHPSYMGTPTGYDLQVLGEAIRYFVIDDVIGDLRDHAEAVITKHAYQLRSTSFVGRCIETANRLLGFPV